MTMTTQSGGRTYVVGQAEVRHENLRIAREVKAILFAALETPAISHSPMHVLSVLPPA